MRWIVPLVYLVLAAATATAAVVAAPQDGPEVAAVAAEGGFALSNSGAGEAIFTAAGIGPGDGTGGTVEVAASGAAADLTLSRQDLTDTPGLGGGLLSARLQLRIRELGAGAGIYSGPLATMPPQHLGRLEPGAPRSFEFEATLPEAGTAVSQNDVQGAATSVTYAWTAHEAGEEPEGEAPPGGGSGGAGGPGGGPASGEAQPDPLDLAVTRVRHRIVRGRLLVWASCDHPCRIAVRGKLRARVGGERRAARLRFRGKAFRQGPQRLRIEVPRKLRRRLAASPPTRDASGSG